MMVATHHQHALSGTQVFGGGPSCLCDPSPRRARQGPGWSGLGTCRGRALPPPSPPSTPPLRGLPIHTTRWGLDLSFNECYPSRPLWKGAEQQSPSARLTAARYRTLTQNNVTLERMRGMGCERRKYCVFHF